MESNNFLVTRRTIFDAKLASVASKLARLDWIFLFYAGCGVSGGDGCSKGVERKLELAVVVHRAAGAVEMATSWHLLSASNII